MGMRSGVAMQVSVLGPVAVLRNDGHLDLGGRLQRLLAALVVADGSVVSVDALVEIVWPEEPPANAARSLRTYVTRLRQALDVDRDDLIEFHQPGYAIDLGPDEIDSRAFEDDLDRALSCLRTADAGSAVELLVAALGRWRGDAYASFAHEEWARPEAVRLEERRIEAREALIEARMGVGAAEQAVAEASALVEAVPLRDRSRMLLMRSLYLAGRQADALRAASEYRSYLVSETGLDPSNEVTELEGRIARGEVDAEGAVQVLHGYELHERIGEGAFAVVHRATQPELRRDVAVKVIRGELADRPDFIRRFEVEAQTVARVEHPNVVPLYDFWREPGAAYLVMRLLRGGSIEQALRAHGPFSTERMVRLLTEVGGALDAAHRAGVVHRDVRPANLLLDADGGTYLADFGIALPTATSDDLPIVSPAYAAPEVLRGEPAGVAADVLSLGVTVFELLTGRLPFAESVDRAEIIRRQMREPLPPVSATRTDLSADLDTVLARATAKAPGDRHGSVVALVAELHDALDGAPAARRRVTTTSGVIENPYVGLHAFTELDSERYFGREALVTELVEALDRHPLVVVVGASGSGKSSAVRAGLLPAVRRGAIPDSDSWFVTTMLPGSDPIDALETALLRVAVNPPATLRAQLDQRGGLLRAIRRVLPDERSQILIVIDQFEELFTQVADREERDRFLTELSAAITAPGSPLRVVATLRADHFDAPLRHREMAELFTAGTVAITPMSPEDLERAITLPARSVGVDVEPALVADLVAGASGSPNVLPLMQFALTEVFDRRIADVMLHETYRELGGITGAMAVRADRIVETGDEADVAAARRLFGRLVTLGEGSVDTRRRVLRTELGAGDRAEALVDEFVAARLLATDRDPASRAPTVEVAHEALLLDWPRLRAWLDEDRADLHTLRRITAAAEAWHAADRDPSDLARGGRLDNACELADRRPEWLNEREAEWLTTSVNAVEADLAREKEAIARDRRQNRRLRQLLTTALVLLVVAGVAAAVALVLRDRAVTSRQDADIERLMAESAAQIREDPDLAILLALEANRRRDDLKTRGAIHRAFSGEQRRIAGRPPRFPQGSQTVLSADATVGLSFAFDGRAESFRPATGETLGTFEHDGRFLDLVLSGNGDVAAVKLIPSGMLLVDPSDGDVIRSILEVDGEPVEMDRPTLDAAGRTAAFTVRGVPYVVDVESGDVREVPLDEYPEIGVNQVVLSDDGSTLYARWFDDPGGTRFGYDVIDVATGDLIRRHEDPGGLGFVTELAVGPDGLVSRGFDDGTLRIEPSPGEQVVLKAHDAEVGDIVIGQDMIATVGGDGFIALWSFDGSTAGPRLSITGEISDVRLDREGGLIVTYFSGGWDVFELDGGVVREEQRQVTFAQLIPDVGWYVTPTDDFAVNEHRRLENDELIARIDFSEVWTTGVGAPTFASPTGAWVMNYSRESTTHAFTEIDTGRQLTHDIEPLFERLTGVDFDSVSSQGIRVTDEGDRFWYLAEYAAPIDGSDDDRRGSGEVSALGAWIDVGTGEVLHGPIELPFSAIPYLLDDGRVVLSGWEQVAIVDVELAEPVRVLGSLTQQLALGQQRGTSVVAFAGPEGSVTLFDVNTEESRRLEDSAGDPLMGTFSPDGRFLAVLTNSVGIELYDLETGRRSGARLDPADLGLMTLPGLAWSEDGKSIWTSLTSPTRGGPVRLQADPDRWREMGCSIVGRELTEQEWRTYVSSESEPVASCGEPT